MMTWYYDFRGSHVHVRVYFAGALCGQLIFRTEEFHVVKRMHSDGGIEFLADTRSTAS